ncbi:hypothetical protein ABW20_dc0102191 [Dactylellina cionopaga]|nr:hypothetical protein ABW20_dc0102191 [Dactylellina cionopaga]
MKFSAQLIALVAFLAASTYAKTGAQSKDDFFNGMVKVLGMTPEQERFFPSLPMSVWDQFAQLENMKAANPNDEVAADKLTQAWDELFQLRIPTGFKATTRRALRRRQAATTPAPTTPGATTPGATTPGATQPMAPITGAQLKKENIDGLTAVTTGIDPADKTSLLTLMNGFSDDIWNKLAELGTKARDSNGTDQTSIAALTAAWDQIMQGQTPTFGATATPVTPTNPTTPSASSGAAPVNPATPATPATPMLGSVGAAQPIAPVDPNAQPVAPTTPNTTPMDPTTQQPTVQQPTVQQPTVQQPTAQQPTVEQPTAQQPTAQPVAPTTPNTMPMDPNMPMDPTAQQPTAQQPTAQQPAAQQPATPMIPTTQSGDSGLASPAAPKRQKV